MKSKWFGWLHKDGSVALRKWRGEKYFYEVQDRPLIVMVYGPWLSSSREEAQATLMELHRAYMEGGKRASTP